MKKVNPFILAVCIYIVATAASIVIGYNRDKKRDRLKAREQFVKDSIAHDPHHQDSVAEAKRLLEKEWNENHKWENEHAIAIIKDSDKHYHTSTECFNIKPLFQEDYESFNIRNFHVIALYDAIDSGYELCPDCEEISETYYKSFDEQ